MTRTYHRPRLYPQQQQALFNDKRFAVTEAATKTGKTTAALVWLFEQALFAAPPGHEYWWVAPSSGQARMAFDRIVRMMPPGFAAVRRTSPLRVTLPHGCAISFRTGENPDLLYGEDVGAVVLDEFTRMREEAWWAVCTTLTKTQGPARLIGNVRGTVGWGYRLARTAEAGDPDWHYARLTWRDGVAAGVIDHDTIEVARRQLPVAVFQALYEARALDGDTHPIGLEAIAACATLDAALDTAPIVWGWDLGRSQSWTAGIALDQRGQVCRVERFKRDWEKTLERIVAATESAVALVDATHGSVGDPILEFLQRDAPAGRFLPFGFTAQTREKLLNELAATIQRGDVSVPRDGPLRAELEALEWQSTSKGLWRYGFPPGMSGDLVIALALAIRQFNQVSPSRYGRGGAVLVVEDETFEQRVRRRGGSWFPGD